MGKITEQQQWEEDIYLIEKQDKVLGGELGVINVQAKQLANRTKYLKDQVDGINRDRTGYAPVASPAFTGIPTAPTASQNTNNTQIATTEFVKTAIAALVGSAPAALDTLEELARALAGDANLKATLLAEIGKKATATDLNALHDLFVGIPIPYPLSTVPTGCLAMNGQRFDTRRYQKLAQKYPSGVLPDLRGEFIRGLDNGRGVDAGRALLSAQSDAIRNIIGQLGTDNGWIFRNPTGAFYDPYNGTNTQRLRAVTTSEGIGDDGRSLGWLSFDASKVVPTANENRPRNIAYHYICLAE
ncbi:phage tail protein [uncultured Haemophilus sp.]|uniref:phage tail protein n=1 Tax=uncultured Haemophilus sp. TaxID=237779 RepID=UPI0025D8CD6D|nr:phage tail protein [uncultured Haemophilus sp.]